MNTDELIKKAIFTYPDNGIYTKYLLPEQAILLPERNICGYHLLVFKSNALKATWVAIFNALKQFVNNDFDLRRLINFEAIHEIDETAVFQSRGFNEAYTTRHYHEFLTDGSCKPSEEILNDLHEMHLALLDFNLPCDYMECQSDVINNLLFECFVKPTFELRWGNHWTLYLPPVSMDHIKIWNEQNE